jgi:hypothetical protein
MRGGARLARLDGVGEVESLSDSRLMAMIVYVKPGKICEWEGCAIGELERLSRSVARSISQRKVQGCKTGVRRKEAP